MSGPGPVSGEVPVGATTLHYVSVGDGPPVVFLHGNPTSSVLWREVIGPVAATGRRCLALDLVGMGLSGRPDIGYRLTDHIGYVDGFLAALDLRRPTLVGHDWGAVIALHRAARHPADVEGVAVMEGHLHPVDSWSDLDPGAQELFRALRTPGVGERMVLEQNVFIETVLPSGILRTLDPAVADLYAAPYLDPAARVPMLVWPREIPIEGEPADVVDVVRRNQQVLRDPAIRTLLLHGDPGAVVQAAEVAWCRENGRSMTVVDVGPGTHFLPEDQPAAIAAALVEWLGAAT